MPCTKCDDIHRAVRDTPVTPGAGSYPSSLELAYMVNLEYYIDISYPCVHRIPAGVDDKAKIKVKDMVGFLEGRKWEIGGRSNNDGFKSTSFLNRPAKQLVIVHRGTENWTQVKTDVLLALGAVTQADIHNADWHTYQSLMNNALKEENNKFVRNDYSVTITGHSLGGWLAQICALISKYPKYHPVGPRGVLSFPNGKSIDMNQPYDLHCVVFDSPGANTVLNQMETTAKAAAWLSGPKRDVENALKTLDISVYLSNRNPVNMCGTHVGKVERIDVMVGASFMEKLNPVASHSMDRILGYFIRKS